VVTNSVRARSSGSRWRAASIAAAAATLVGFACSSPELAQQPTSRASSAPGACASLVAAARDVGSPANIAAAESCFDSVDLARRNVSLGLIRVPMESLAVVHFQIPEYHDEQRLSDRAGALGPVTRIYASPYLGDFKYLWQFEEHGSVGILVAMVSVEPLRSESVPRTYGLLHLVADSLNCVWLSYGATPQGTKWQAYVSHVAWDKPCDRSGRMLGPLDVGRDYGGPDSAYPPVARFGAARDSQPLLGLRCLAAWCEIGPRGFQHVPLAFNPQKPLETVKGWFDEQDLADEIGNRWVPVVHASIVPVPNVDALPPQAFDTGQVHVATINLASAPPAGSKYARWGLVQGENLLYLSRVAIAGATTGTTPGAGGAPTQASWRTFLGQPGMQMANRTPWDSVIRMPHWDADVPGTARFRWTIEDDGVWVPCGQACCQAEGPFR
jgi:hypothetical protein